MFRVVLMVVAMVLSHGISHAEDDSGNNIFKSPTGRYTANIIKLRQHDVPTMTGGTDDVSYIGYVIVFVNTADNTSYTLKFNDVYDPPTPRSQKQLFSSITWSPKDDFAILPGEELAYYGPPLRNVINLNPEYGWSTSTFQMTTVVWADDLRIFGNVADDCNYHVDIFDGWTGQTRSIFHSQTPVGFEIIEIKNSKLLVTKFLDNCMTDEDRKIFKKVCWNVDMTTLKTELTDCPK